MHGRIFEIREQRMPKEEWLNETDLYDEDTSFADYYRDSEDREDDLEWLKSALPSSMFKMEGDEIEIISDGKEIMEKFIDRIKAEANELSYESVVKGVQKYKLGLALKGALHSDFMFYTDTAGYCHDSTEFLTDCINYCQGKKLYVCGILDYHF